MIGIFKSDADRIRWQLKCRLHEIVNNVGQVKAAELIGIHQSNLSRALNNEHNTRLETLIFYLKKLGMLTTIKVSKY